MDPPGQDQPGDKLGLDALVGELSKLKSALGYDEEKEVVSGIEDFVKQITDENEEYRLFAEQAIMGATELKAENESLQESVERLQAELNDVKTSAMLAKTQELTQAAFEYDQEVVENAALELETYREEVTQLMDRVAELEQENAGLTETLSEMRQSTQQLQRLQQSALVGTPTTRVTAGDDDNTPFQTPGEGENQISPSMENVYRENADSIAENNNATTPVKLMFNIQQPASDASPAPGGGLLSPAMSFESDDPASIADALVAAAGGAQGGLVGKAAKMLKSYDQLKKNFDTQQQEVVRLQREVDQLHELTLAETFKPPSAWAEREVKYKQDKRRWEEQTKENDTKLTALKSELAVLRAGNGLSNLETRIQELEAQVLQTQGERDAARSALHELQLSNRRAPGEYEKGVRTSDYAGPTAAHAAVEHFETISDSATPSPRNSGSAKVQKGAAPPTVDSKQPSALALRAQEIERRLAGVENAKAAIEAELAAAAAAARSPAEVNEVQQVDWKARKMLTELTLLKKGVAAQNAQKLAALDTELQQMQFRPIIVDGNLSNSAAISPISPAPRKPAEAVTSISQSHVAKQQEQEDDASDSEGADEDDSMMEARQQIMAEIDEILAAENISPTANVPPVVALKSEDDEEVAAADSSTGVAAVPAVVALLKCEDNEVAAADSSTGVATVRVAATFQPLAALLASANDDEPVKEKELALEAVERIEILQASLQHVATANSEKVSMPINIAGPATEKVVVPINISAPATERVVVPINIAAAAPATERFSLNIAVADQDNGNRDARIKELEAMLHAKQQEEEQLRAELQTLPRSLQLKFNVTEAPVQLQLNVADQPAKPLVRGSSSGGSSVHSLAGITMESLAKDRAEAEAAWNEHQKSSDTSSLLRNNAELEARCALLESQMSKLQTALNLSETDKDMMEQQINTAMTTGNVAGLASFRDKMKSGNKGFVGLTKPNKKSFNVFKKKTGPSKEAMVTALHDTQDALQEAETERNTLRRQLARMSEQKRKASPSKDPGATTPKGPASVAPSVDDNGSLQEEPINGGAEEMIEGRADMEDIEKELDSLREENDMLMEQLVTTKVKFAETHGDYLEARRTLLRSREKQLQLINDLQTYKSQAEEAKAHLRPLQAGPLPGAGGPPESPRI